MRRPKPNSGCYFMGWGGGAIKQDATSRDQTRGPRFFSPPPLLNHFRIWKGHPNTSFVIIMQTIDKTVFTFRLMNVGFVVDKVALGQVSLRVCLFFPVSIVPPLLHTPLILSYVHSFIHSFIHSSTTLCSLAVDATQQDTAYNKISSLYT